MNPHHDILTKAIKKTEESAVLNGDKIYYECRKPPMSRQGFNKDIGSLCYTGKLNSQHAECISIQPLSVYALKGKVIGFQCIDKPSGPYLFQFRGIHKGSFGYLTEQVICKILCQFQNIPYN